MWLSVIPVKWWKQLKNVLEFAGSSRTHVNSVIKYTNKEIREKASNLWMTDTWKFTNKRELIFYNKDKKQYFSHDNTQHVWWFWKWGNTIESLNSKNTRSWTYDSNLNYIWE